MAPTLHKGTETFTESVQEKFKITDLKQKFDIQVTTQQLQEYKDMLFDMKEVQKIKEKSFTIWEIIKNKSKLYRENIQASKNVQKSQEYLAKQIKRWEIEAEKWVESAEQTLEELKDTDVWKKAKKLWKDTKLAIKKWVETVKSWWFMLSLEKAKESWGILGFLAWLLLSLLGILGLWKKAEILKNKLNPEEIRKTREAIAKKIKEEFLPNKNVPEILKIKLNEVVNNPELISEENLVKLSEKLKSWKKLDIIDIRYILKDSWEEIENELYDDEAKDALKLELESNIIKSIEQNYWLNFNTDKREKTIELVREHITGNVDDYVILEQKLRNKDEMLWAIDVVKFLWVKPFQFANFTMSLISENIITPDKVWTQITKAWKIILKTPFNIITSEWITSDEYISKLEWLSEEKRWVFLGILLRQWQALTDILWSAAEFASRSILELASPNIQSWAKMWWNSISSSFTNNYGEQIKSFKKIERFLGSNVWHESIDVMKKSLQQVTVNASIISELDNYKDIDDIWKLKSKIKNISWISEDILKWIDSYTDITKLRWFIWENIHFNANISSGKIWSFLNHIQHNAKWQTIDFTRNIENIVKSQREIIRGWPEKYLNFIKKYREIVWQANIARQAKSINIEAKSASWVISKMEWLSKLANDFPLLAKSTFGMLPQFAFTVLDYELTPENEQDFVKSLWRTALYMSWIVWPLVMTLSPKAYVDNKGNLEWFNIAEAWVWAILLWIDSVKAAKLALEWKYLKVLTDVVLRPISAPWKFLMDSYRVWKDIVWISKAGWKINWWKIGSKVAKEAKKWKWIKKALVIWLLVWAAYTANELMKTDLSDEIENLVDKWIIDKSWNIISPEWLNNIYNTLELDEKSAFINILFWTKWTVIPEDIEITLKDNSHLEIVSKNSWVRNKQWFVNGELTSILSDLWIEYDNIDFKYIETEKPA